MAFTLISGARHSLSPPEGGTSNDAAGFASCYGPHRRSPLQGLLTLGSDPARFQTKPPACYRASWQLPGPDFHRQATTSLRTARTTMATSRCHLPLCWAHESIEATERQEPIARLRAWVEQVYRPGYGHLAAGLGPCWPSHDLCLYGLDIASELWSVLYLQPDRSPGLVSAQAEYQARILPALADQLRLETHTCGHPRSPAPADGQPWSRP